MKTFFFSLIQAICKNSQLSLRLEIKQLFLLHVSVKVGAEQEKEA
ncbi:hypothetical protein [Flexibacterium corallicola]|nr:hypothetical protein [Pseudovibrio sp. M1P-2-3]